jgi:hypothetical protein
MVVPGKEDLALAGPTNFETAVIQRGQSGYCGAALLKGRIIGGESLLNLGRRKQQRFSGAQASQAVLQVVGIHSE